MTKGALPSNAKMVFKGEIFEVWQWPQTMYDGTTVTFERLRRDDSAQVIAVVDGKILLQTQEQPDRTSPFLSLPGGRIEEGEDPLVGAKRELLEESGYASDDWELFSAHSPYSKIEYVSYTYIARQCSYVQAPMLDAGEKIETQAIDFDSFLSLSDNPAFRGGELRGVLLRARYEPAEKEKLHRTIFGS